MPDGGSLIDAAAMAVSGNHGCLRSGQLATVDALSSALESRADRDDWGMAQSCVRGGTRDGDGSFSCASGVADCDGLTLADEG